MNRAERRAELRARRGHLRGETRKGYPTPRNTPGEMTRARFEGLQRRRADRVLKDSTIGRAIDMIMGAKRGEKAALEELQRQAGGVILDPLKGR